MSQLELYKNTIIKIKSRITTKILLITYIKKPPHVRTEASLWPETIVRFYAKYYMVGLSGLEPLTSRLSGVRSNQLSYRPVLSFLIVR